MLHPLRHCVVEVEPLPLQASHRVMRTVFLHFGQYLSSVTIPPFRCLPPDRCYTRTLLPGYRSRKSDRDLRPDGIQVRHGDTYGTLIGT
jgi:hypothetical protein